MNALFHRQFLGYTGGHGKVWDYFNHCTASSFYNPLIFFTKDSIFDNTNPWMNDLDKVIPDWEPEKTDLLFLAGMDWSALPAKFPINIPIINLIQGFRHANPELPLYNYLQYHAIRICVSQVVADGILATKKVNGPVFVIPNGIEIPETVRSQVHTNNIFIGALKNPTFGSDLAAQLTKLGYEVDLLTVPVPRINYFERIGKARLAVFLPQSTEGFYLPGLEAMALGTPVIMPDCVGNREYTKHGENCLIASENKILDAVHQMDSVSLQDKLSNAGIDTARKFSLQNEREKFYDILEKIISNQLWQF